MKYYTFDTKKKIFIPLKSKKNYKFNLKTISVEKSNE